MQHFHVFLETGDAAHVQKHEFGVEKGLGVVLRPNQIAQKRDFERVLLPGMLQRRVFHRERVQLLENGFVCNGLAAIDRIVACKEIENQRSRFLVEHIAAIEDQFFVIAAQLLQIVHQIRQAFLPVGCGKTGFGKWREDLSDRLEVRNGETGKYEFVFVVG